jgi:predicted nucleic acid-binding protein
MAASALLDTNLLIYAHDRSEPQKQQRALLVLDRVQSTGAGALTTQILGEFSTTATRRLSASLTLEAAARQVELMARVWPVFDVTAFTILEALRGTISYQMSYWDAQIWASALLNQVPIILSEDFNSGAVLEGVRFLNPFADDFDLDAWLPA